jgi:uncharacterized membrane protein YebE (DUF533 family)
VGHTQQVLAAVVLPQRGGGLQGRVLIHGKRSRALAHNSFSLAGFLGFALVSYSR